MKSRIEVSLTPEEHRHALARAAQLGISFAEYVRRLVARDLVDTTGNAPPPHALFDLGDSGGSDVARNKHRYVDDAVQRREGRRVT